jgi:hypothetical protein
MRVKIEKAGIPFLIFYTSFSFFVLKNSYYLPSSLEITLRRDDPDDIVLSWDSGSGFNEREKLSVFRNELRGGREEQGAYFTRYKGRYYKETVPLPQLDIKALRLDTLGTLNVRSVDIRSERGVLDLPISQARTVPYRCHTLEIQRLPEKNPAATDGWVPIREIWLNRVPIDLNVIASDTSSTRLRWRRSAPPPRVSARVAKGNAVMGAKDYSYLLLMTDGCTVACSGALGDAGIVFRSDRRCGKTRILVDGREYQILDLYSPYGTCITVPIAIAKDAASIPVNEINGMSNVVFEKVTPNTKKLHPALLAVQLLLALCLSWLSYEFLRLKRRFSQPDWKSTFSHILVRDKHWIFWSLFVVSAGIFFLWLLGQWPGIIAADTTWQWTQAHELNFPNESPYMYTLYLVTLTQFFDSPATVAIFQILVTSALGSFIFYFVLKHGNVRAIYIAVFYICFTFSIPIGVNTITLWKDEPFTILVLFWAFYVFYIYYRKRMGFPVNFTFKSLWILSFLLILMSLMRHNGIVYLVTLPLIILIVGLMPKKRFIQFVLLSSIIYCMFQYVVPVALEVHKKTDYARLKFGTFGSPFIALFAGKGYYSDNYEGDAQIMEKLATLGELRNVYDPGNGDNPLDPLYARFKRLSGEDKDKILALFYKRAIPNLPIIMADRVHVFLAALGFKPTLGAYNALASRESWWANDPGFSPLFRFTYSPKCLALSKCQLRLLNESAVYRGVRSGSFIYWNAFVPLLLISATFILYKWLPLSAMYSLVVLIQSVFILILIPIPEFKYVYFIYLCGIFVVPLVMLEVRCRSRGARKPL